MKNKFIYQLIFFGFLFCYAAIGVNAQETWRGIVPYVTTKEEVEKNLGKPTRGSFYELDEGRVLIKYVEIECAKKIECHCLAPLGTVQFIDVNLYYDLYFKDLTLDLTAFERKLVSPDPIQETYANWKIGIVYSVYEGKVSHIYYYESEATCKLLKEKNKLN